MKNKLIFCVLFFSFSSQVVAAQKKTDVKNMTAGDVAYDFFQEAVNQGYPLVKKQVVSWFYNQLTDITTPLKLGATLGIGVAATGLTIFVVYQVYDKYLRHELTKEQTEQEISDAIYVMVADDLTYPSYSAKIYVLLKKDEFLNFLNDIDAIFAESCNKTIARITAEKGKRDAQKDAAIDAKMNEVIRGIVQKEGPTASNEKKLKYVTDVYIKDRNKFDPFTYNLINCVEVWSAQLLGSSLSEKDINTLNERIRSFKEYLLSHLSIEQRAAYSLYLRFKNKVAVEKQLSPTERAIRNPFAA